ncbi:MAG: glycosyltransferase, partial [Planctomycetota bacterium]
VFLDQKIMANFRGYYDIDPARRARVVLPKRLERKEPNLTVGYVSANDIKGGAQKVAWVLKQRVKQRGFPTKMFVGKKFSNDPDVEIITDAIQDGGTHYTDQGYMYYDVNSTFDLVSQTEFMRCDVVHYHNLHGNYFNPFALSTLTKSKPSVWTLHDMHSMTGHCAYAFDCDKWQIGCGNCPHPESYPPIDKDVTSEMWRDKKLIYNESDFELIVPSQWLKDIVEKSILKDKNVHLIYNGINEHIYKPHDRRAVRRKFNVPDNAIILGFIADGGLIAKRKGGDFILAAYEYFRPKYKNVCFACIGGKSNKAPAERFLQIPYVVDENLLAELYCVADVFMFPTLADNCPLVVLELMGCGVPVISFNVGGVPELIEQGRTGFIAGYKNTEEFVKMVEHLVLNKAKREQFSKAGLERLQKMFTLDQMIDKHIVLYERLAEQAAKKNYVPPKNKVILSAAGGDKQYEYLVSAIVSTYNSEKHIHGCLHDLENQTIADKLEIIVVNSGSKQNEDAIVKEFQSRYDNIKYIRTKKRETIYNAWNRAIKAASGKYITNANTDDRHANDALEKMVLALEKNPNKVLVYADCIKVKEVNRKRIPVGEYIAGEFSRSLLFEGKCPPAYQPLWRKNVHDVFGYFDEEFIVSGDYEFWFRLTQKFDFLYLNKIVGECLIGSEAVSQTDDDFLNWENEMVIRKCYEYAMQEAMTIGATGISRHPVFSTWPEVNLWKQRAKAKLSGKQMARTDYVKNTWDYRTKPAPKLTVVIVTYNRRTELLENLNTLNDQTDKDFEVIVVDNSGDLAELKNSVDKFNYGLCGVELNLNLGPSLARNIGTQFAKAGYIAFLDDDAVADKHLVRNIVEHFENHRISGLRGKVLPKTQTNLQNIPVNYDLGDQIITTACEVSSLSAFRKDVLVKMGGFDELLFGSEGMELSYRICKAQKEKVKSILYFPDVIVYHDHRPKGPAQTEKILRKQWMGLLAWRKDNDIKAYRELVCSLYPGRKDIFEDNLLELEGKGLRPVVRPEMETKQCVLNSSVPHKLPSKERKEISVCPSGSDRGFITTTFNAGLCNRIYEWTVLRELSDYYKMDILLNWSEIKDGTVELPNTHYFDFSKASKKFLNSFITINTASTKLSHVADLNLNQNKNYILTCGWEFNRSLTDHDKRLKEVKLNIGYTEKIESFLAQYGDARIVGLHVRRGDYKVTEGFKTNGNFRIPDSWYLDVAGRVLARFPDTKFFLATDGTNDEKKVFFDNLPVISICSDGHTPHQDVVELFTLTKLPLLIASASTFSMFAESYGRPTVLIWPTRPKQQIDEQLQQYQNMTADTLGRPVSPDRTVQMYPTTTSVSCRANEGREYLVTAIVSTYNSERFLRGCLDDLEQQTIADKLEIIIVNSGSKQNEDAIVRQYQRNHNNIVYIKTERREGVYAAWNRAVKAARGKFITNANTDDRHRNDALEIMASTLQTDPDIALVYGDQIRTETPNDTFENHHGTQMDRRPEYSRARLLFGCCVGSQPMWRKSLHNEFAYFDDTLTCAADWDFWLRISSEYKFRHIPEFLGLYYYNEDGIEHGRRIHSLYERYIVGKRYGTPYISVIPLYQSKDNPLVSVIMPAYNAAEYITKAIESVLIQNYRNFELIVVDDGSIDNTRDIVAGFKDERIKYFYKENAGPASARNLAIKKAKGTFIVSLDSDDMITPDFIAKHMKVFEKHPQADLIYCDDCLIDEDDKPIRVIERPEYSDKKL